ncbi:replication initiation protein [Candidatus Bealeia paramacronuclearis]|uniref:replication initiation protein n=1 Tax=Candidatus Bealeia paramacronuclearis TaxID=1921001 RepID=UPI002F266F45
MASSSVVRQSNDLIQASYKMSLNEQRLIYIAISKIPFNEKKENRTVEITAEEFLAAFPSVGKGNVHIELRKSLDDLWAREILLSSSQEESKIRWLTSQSRYLQQSGRLKFSFSPEILPYLENLKERFTIFHLFDIKNLSTTYALRIFELLMQFQTTGVVIISLEQCKFRLGLEDNYKDYRDFKKRIISPSINDINKKTRIKVTFSAKKRGKTVDSLHFFFSEKVD